MTDYMPTSPAGEDAHARLEQAFIAEYLRSHGYWLEDLETWPPDRARALLAEASCYASARLAEVEARARFVEEIDESRQRW